MAMLDDVLGGAAPGAGNRLCTTRSRRMGGLGAAPWWSGMSIAAVLICAGALVITSDAANARSSGRSSAKASAATRPRSMRRPSMTPNWRRRRAKDALLLPARPHS